MSGPTGLVYEAAYPLMERLHLSSVEWAQLFDDLQEMEQAALERMREND